MTHRSTAVLLLALAVACVAPAAVAERLDCGANRHMEVVAFNWELNGILSFFAGFRFPTDGTGSLATVQRSDATIGTELRILSGDGDGDLYLYKSEVDPPTLTTLVSIDGYEFEGRRRITTTTFDYAARTMNRVRVDTKPGGHPGSSVDPIPQGEIRDVLSTIYYLRKSATTLQKPVEKKVYSAGKLYSVLLTPGKVSSLEFRGEKVSAKQYTISATAAETKKWPGDVSFWLTRDDQAIPIRILIRQTGASLDLRARAVYTCP